MAEHLFLAKPVLDESNNLVANATGQVFAITDTSFSNPLTITTLAGDTRASWATGEAGVLSDFKLVGSDPPLVVVWKSGSYTTAITSFDALTQRYDAARADALAASAAALESANDAEGALSALNTLLLTAVLSVNGIMPDEDGNVTIAIDGGGSGGGAVLSVNGKTGAVSLVKADVGLSNVDNTSDANKPVSGPQATALSGKAATVHTHAQVDVEGLVAALASKRGVNDPLNVGLLTGPGRILASLLGAGTADDTVVLYGDGQWRTPPGGGSGGAVVSVNGKTGTVTITAADVGALPTSTTYVATVAGRSGSVTLAKADVGLGAVDNTPDADKPVSGPVANALSGKADDSATVHRTGNESIAGVKTFTSAPVVPNDAFSIAKVAGLLAALAGRVESVGGSWKFQVMSKAAYNALGSGRDTSTIYATYGS